MKAQPCDWKHLYYGSLSFLCALTPCDNLENILFMFQEKDSYQILSHLYLDLRILSLQNHDKETILVCMSTINGTSLQQKWNKTIDLKVTKVNGRQLSMRLFLEGFLEKKNKVISIKYWVAIKWKMQKASNTDCCGIILPYTVNMHCLYWLIQKLFGLLQDKIKLGNEEGQSQRRYQPAMEQVGHVENDVTRHEPCGEA